VPSESGGAVVEETNNVVLLVYVPSYLVPFKFFTQICRAIGHGIDMALYDSLF
jgi:hypothetical protein